ncbi:MAG: NIPSNAP family protein [Chloroflexi bacterium]|nr:NIPSNAP family protein [Chloroflexota bacterium]MDA1297066.1 NIPSNAP family protein [Chloroflexota bacterium]
MTVAHLRTYTINKGHMDAWLKLFDEKLVPLLDEHGIKVDGTWVNEEQTQFIWVRSYGDTAAGIEAKEAAFYGSEWWKANVDHVRSFIAHREIKLVHSV